MNGPPRSAIESAKVGRNDPCPCGSRRKYKNCCLLKESRAAPHAMSTGASPPSSAVASMARARALFGVAMRLWDAGRRVEAIAALREVVRRDPGTPDAHYNLGYAYYRMGRLLEAAASFRRTLELRPSFDEALGPLASCLEHLGQEGEAVDAFRRLSRSARNAVERHMYLGKALLMEGRREEAEKELRLAAAIAPENARAQTFLGRLLVEEGSFEEAWRRLTVAVETEPAAFQALSETKRMTEADRPLIERMRVIADREALEPNQLAPIRFGLGKALDDLGDYAEAMRHFEAGNRLKAPSMRADPAAFAARYDRIIADFPAASFKAGQRLARSQDDLAVLIVGMPRSGTTLVEQILSSHPSVAAGGELSFWADRETERQRRPQGNGPDTLALSGAARDYEAVLRAIGPEAQRVTDKAPQNFERLGLIRRALPAARIIHCRRGPIDTCLSTYVTNFKGRTAWNRADLVFQYRQYERLMEHWRHALTDDRFTELRYEALIEDPEGETRRLVAFCGLEWSDRCLAPERNPRAVSSASLWQARQPVYATSIERWRRYESWLGEFRELASPPFTAAEKSGPA